MTTKNEIDTLKTLAKRYARANRIAQHEALNALAAELDFASWTKLSDILSARCRLCNSTEPSVRLLCRTSPISAD